MTQLIKSNTSVSRLYDVKFDIKINLITNRHKRNKFCYDSCVDHEPYYNIKKNGNVDKQYVLQRKIFFQQFVCVHTYEIIIGVNNFKFQQHYRGYNMVDKSTRTYFNVIGFTVSLTINHTWNCDLLIFSQLVNKFNVINMFPRILQNNLSSVFLSKIHAIRRKVNFVLRFLLLRHDIAKDKMKYDRPHLINSYESQQNEN